MLEIGIIVLVFMAVSLLLQECLAIPMPISLMSITLLLVGLGIDELRLEGEVFDELILLLLPLLITADVINLKTKDLAENWKTVFFTAGVAVVTSIVVGVALHQFILPGYEITIAAMVALMAMIAATDPVSVAATFSNYKVPHKLKFIAESESLFNDATAFVIFTLALMVMTQPMGVVEIAEKSVITVVSSLLTGIVIGLAGVWLLRFASQALTETAVVLLTGYLAFFIADELGEAAIFALVTSLVTVKAAATYAHNNLQPDQHKPFAHLAKIYQNRGEIVHFLSFAALIANVLLFISMAHLFNLSALLAYWKEILAVFIGSTLIRAVVMWQFMRISNRNVSMQSASVDWWAVLVFAGVKGGCQF